MEPSWQKTFTGPPEVAEAIRKIHARIGGLTKAMVDATRGFPPPGPETSYWMGRSLSNGQRLLIVGEEVTHLAPDWYRAGTMSNLLQKQYVVAHPQANVWAPGVPPSVVRVEKAANKAVPPTPPAPVKSPPAPSEGDVVTHAVADPPKPKKAGLFKRG